jgi:alpha-galactosidase
MRGVSALLLALGLLGADRVAVALDNGAAQVPPMGVNTWNSLRCTDAVNARNIKRFADAMVAKGLARKGFDTLVIDDCWSLPVRHPDTRKLQADPAAFPGGMRPVADYVHGLNLTLGMYSDRGTKTCAGRPGSGGFETIDAEYFAKDVGIDLLKYDSCFATSDRDTAFAEYGRMRDALNHTGRRVTFQACGWNAWYAPEGAKLANTWRIGADADDWLHIYRGIRTNEALGSFAGPGHFNDPDMLVGSGKDTAVFITPEQSRTQFNVWAVMASPLIIGASLTDMTSWDLETYSNSKVIEVNQDPLGIQGRPVYSDCPGKPYVPLEQASPTTFPLNITPWTWSWALLRQCVLLSMGLLAVCLLIFMCIVKRCIGERANYSVLNGPEAGKGPTDISSSFYVNGGGARAISHSDSARVPAAWRCACKSCAVFMGMTSLAVFVTTLWLMVVLSWGVDPCTQVWAKPLRAVNASKRVALVFVNYDVAAKVVRCDAACLTSAGFEQGDLLYAEDLWGGDAPSKISKEEIECSLGASTEGGTSCMLVVTRRH